MHFQLLNILLVLFPLFGALIAGLGGKRVSNTTAHFVTIFGVAAAFAIAVYFAYLFFVLHIGVQNHNLYIWNLAGPFLFNLGFLVDPLTIVMFLIVTFVSLLVHIYSIAYMAGDPGYKRFFSYMSAFTFAMLMLVSANNFLQLYFGWEAVGLVSYLLIGFWFRKESANAGSLKAFLVNRIGDFGFLLGIALLFNYFGSLDYFSVFQAAHTLQYTTLSIFPGTHLSVITLICFLLFIGAMGKSAQMPLHVWLPESMEGPTPISALIHAATMVTAGVYLVARLSPLYEYSTAVLNFILVLGASTALFMGLVAIVQNDIKRVIAYSTLSQLGYMMVALGASAYAAGIFHLVTHAFFKALLFLCAGSVILALHHEQDMRKMGGLAKLMPITCGTFLIGALALTAIPPFAGYYSKDVIINAVHLSHLSAAGYAYYCVLIGAFVTSLYTFRAFFLIFFTDTRLSEEQKKHIHESPGVVKIALIGLAVPSLIAGFLLMGPFLKSPAILSSVLFVLPAHAQQVLLEPLTVKAFIIDHLALWFALMGIATAWLCYSRFPFLPDKIKRNFSWLYQLLVRKYGFDEFNQTVFVDGGLHLAKLFFKADTHLLDHYLVNGAGRGISWVSSLLRRLQSGYLYQYSWVMVASIVFLLLIFAL